MHSLSFRVEIRVFPYLGSRQFTLDAPLASRIPHVDTVLVFLNNRHEARAYNGRRRNSHVLATYLPRLRARPVFVFHI